MAGELDDYIEMVRKAGMGERAWAAVELEHIVWKYMETKSKQSLGERRE